MSLEKLPPGELAAVVTYLEMHASPAIAIPPSALRLERRERIAPTAYRALFRKVGGPWLWFSRLIDSDAQLTRVLHHPALHLLVAIDRAGAEVGFLELDFRDPGACELSFVGLVPRLTGQGNGRWLLAEAVSRAWAGTGVTRVHVHTCSLDHPAALTAYRHAGFTPYARAIERFADPRIGGVLPPDCAPQVPLLGTATSTAR